MKPQTKNLLARSLILLLSITPALGPFAQELQRVWTVPPVGTFWSAQLTNQPPLPFLPGFLPEETPVYLLSADGIFLYDDRQVDYEMLIGLRQATESVTYPPGPGEIIGDGTDTNTYPPGPLGIKYATNDLWLEITNISTINGIPSLCVAIHGTIPDVVYEIFSKEILTNPPWATETIVLGFPDRTPAIVPLGARTNSLFLWARSWVDTDANGMPDWWQIGWFGSTGVDPYGDPDNDGWTNLQEYQNGTNPKSGDTPPPPRNVSARLDSTGTNVVLSWESGGGPVTSYVIRLDSAETGDFVDIGTTTASNLYFTNSTDYDYFGYDPLTPPVYMVRAYLTNGAHSDSEPVLATAAALTLTTHIVRGPDAKAYLALASPPQTLALIRIIWQDNGVDQALNVYPTNLHNGIAELPTTLPWTQFRVHLFDNQGRLGSQWLYPDMPGTDLSSSFAPLFTNLSSPAHLKENLKFLLRSSTLTLPFSYASLQLTGPYPSHPRTITQTPLFPEDFLARGETGTNYEYYGFRTFSPTLGYSVLQPFRPAQENALWRNFVYNAADINANGDWTTGAEYFSTYIKLRLLPYPYYGLSGWTGLPLPMLLTSNNSIYAWGCRVMSYQYGDTAEVGLMTNANFDLSLPFGTRNAFGLTIDSVLGHVEGTLGTFTLQAGGVSHPWPQDISDYYPQAAIPSLQTTNYYFASQTPYFRYASPRPPVPGSPDFTVSNSSQPLIAAFGDPFSVAAWAKQTILNGYPGKFAYLEQYFDKAYKLNSLGAVTTNETGILSPYGEFLPTESGPVALLTAPDIETGARGTGVVHVIKLQLDVNHDGVMDPTLAGPDNTTEHNPFLFWLNNDYDRWHYLGADLDQDDLSSTDRDSQSPYTNAPAADSEYRTSTGERVIPSERDLEDFARLWISGITSNLLAALPPGTTGELNWGDKGNPNASNPTIDLFGAADADGGVGYLTNYLTALNQTNRNRYPCVDTLAPGGSLTILFKDSSGTWNFWEHFIWCGAKGGFGKLTFTITQGGTNTLAQTSAYIELKDIKQTYERYTVGDNPNTPPTNVARLADDGIQAPFHYPPPTATNTPYILLVHDYDLPAWKKDRFAETAFKRLYWQGYQGRFGLFRWPGVYTQSAPYSSESNAWRSATGLLNVLTNLSTQYPNNVYLMAHGYGTIAAGEALLIAWTNSTVNTYIAMQGAVPCHAYDPTAPIRLIPPAADNGTPNRYLNYYSLGAPCYFYGVAGASAYINYFNTNDYVLTNLWRYYQDSKPASGYHWNGTTFSKNLIPPYELLLFPADTYEIFAFCDEARSEAIGAQPNLGGPFRTLQQVDLAGMPYSFAGKQKDHSAQFLSHSADNWQFWRAVLRSTGLKP